LLTENHARDGAVSFVPDAPLPAAGPAAGLLGAAAVRPGAALLVLACDLPRVPVALLERLVREHRGWRPAAAWVVPVRGDRLEPLCALYAPAALAALAQRAREGRNALHELAAVQELPRREVAIEEVEELAGIAEPLLNLNTRGELERGRALEEHGR
jgi:molybdopterin-guanine dinucleotide biosynthesis protein A